MTQSRVGTESMCCLLQKNESFIEEGRVESDGCLKSPSAMAITTRKPAVLGERDLKSLAAESECAKYWVDEGVRVLCSFPLLFHDRVRGALDIGSRGADAYSPEDVELLSEVAKQIAIAVENAQAYREITELKDRLAKENVYLEEEVRTDYDFNEIVGKSAALRQVLKEVETVAPTGSTVLIRQNVIERSVILSRGPVLEIPLSEFKQQAKSALADFSSSLSTLEDAERKHILRALGETNWIIGGPAGAAFKLGMKRTTLQSKMRRLGIARPQLTLPGVRNANC
jgi:transcriptional regulator with GAF, ATPase, and Fis domain